jgi:hypothetical protein
MTLAGLAAARQAAAPTRPRLTALSYSGPERWLICRCTRCGRPYLSLVKSAGNVTRDAFIAKMHGDPDPGSGQVWWYKANPGLKPMGGRCLMITVTETLAACRGREAP